MAVESLQDLFVEELRDMYDGEKRLIRALPRMANAATSQELGAAFRRHLAETERQATRLEQVFRSIGETPRGKKCDGIIGIVEEGRSAIEELDGAVLDAALIGGAQKVEHYEIASYGTLAYFAELLGHDRAKALLGETLEEEKATDAKLTELAESRVNREALLAAGSDEEDDNTAARRRGTATRGSTTARRTTATRRSDGTGRRAAKKR